MTTQTMTLPEIIKSEYDGVAFSFWLGDHPEINELQGWAIERNSNNIPFRIGSHLADADWLYNERKILNDWIRTYRNRPDFRAKY
jgi:hypothetical protein